MSSRSGLRTKMNRTENSTEDSYLALVATQMNAWLKGFSPFVKLAKMGKKFFIGCWACTGSNFAYWTTQKGRLQNDYDLAKVHSPRHRKA